MSTNQHSEEQRGQAIVLHSVRWMRADGRWNKEGMAKSRFLLKKPKFPNGSQLLGIFYCTFAMHFSK
jgi:hypothetical protein